MLINFYPHLHVLTMFYSANIVRWVAESRWPFQIVNDCGFQSLMKTGCPGYQIPSAETVSCDVKGVFMCVWQHIAHMLQVMWAFSLQETNYWPDLIGVWWCIEFCDWHLDITQSQGLYCNNRSLQAWRCPDFDAFRPCWSHQVAFRCQPHRSICWGSRGIWNWG